MTEPNRQSGENEEKIIEIEIERLRPFKEHPFQVKDDKEMFLLQESIEKYFLVLEIVEVFVLSGFFDVFQKIFKFFVVPHCKTGSQRFVI